MAAKTNVDRDGDVISEINITPFVDVVLVLLIILMVTSVEIVRSSFIVKLPKAASGGDAIPSTLNLVLTKDNKLFSDGVETSEAALAAKVQEQAKADPQLQAVIAADKDVPYGAVVHLIDLIKRHGVAAFVLNIEKVPGPEPGPGPGPG